MVIKVSLYKFENLPHQDARPFLSIAASCEMNHSVAPCLYNGCQDYQSKCRQVTDSGMTAAGRSSIPDIGEARDWRVDRRPGNGLSAADTR